MNTYQEQCHREEERRSPTLPTGAPVTTCSPGNHTKYTKIYMQIPYHGITVVNQPWSARTAKP